VTTSESGHVDVAAYALGVLNAVDMERFEFHVAWCESCATELEALIPTVSALSQVDRDAFVESEQIAKNDRLLYQMIDVVALRRRRALAMRTVGIAAGFILLVIFAIVGTPAVPGSGSRTVDPNALARPSATGRKYPTETSPTPSPAPSSEVHTGIGGPDLAGERFTATDPATGVRLDVLLESFSWGTQIGVSMFNVAGPLECQLYAVDRAGTASVVASWRVSEWGYGTVVNPEPLTLTAATRLPRSQIAQLFVHGQPPGGPPSQLVTVTP
jgi:Putative zinc-finger